jgi:hypothetical protein
MRNAPPRQEEWRCVFGAHSTSKHVPGAENGALASTVGHGVPREFASWNGRFRWSVAVDAIRMKRIN